METVKNPFIVMLEKREEYRRAAEEFAVDLSTDNLG
jgi:hypothetical protein